MVICYNCKEYGHPARMCTATGSSSRGVQGVIGGRGGNAGYTSSRDTSHSPLAVKVTAARPSRTVDLKNIIWLVHPKYRRLSAEELRFVLKNERGEGSTSTTDEEENQSHKLQLGISDSASSLRPCNPPTSIPRDADRLNRFYVNAMAEDKFEQHVFFEEAALSTEIRENVLDFLHCTICQETSFPPTWTCINNHLICDICKQKLLAPPAQKVTCPSCGESKLGFTRCVEAELFVDSLEFKCLFSDFGNGCQQTLNGSKFMDHVNNECKTRPWKCPFCKDLVQLETIADHLLDSHPENYGFGLAHTKNCSRFFVRIPMVGENADVAFGIFRHDVWDATFIIYQVKVGILEYFYGICFVGSEKEAKRYTANVSSEIIYKMVSSPSETKVEEWKNVRVLSVQNSIGDIIEKFGKIHAEKPLPIVNIRYSSCDRTALQAESKLNIFISRHW